MWPYWLLFLIPAYWAITRLKPIQQGALIDRQDGWPFLWKIAFILLVLMIGFRHEVGGDWETYLLMMNSYSDTSLNARDFGFQDPAFVLLNLISVKTGLGIYLLNILSAIFFCWGLFVFCRVQPRPWLALAVAVPYLITVVAMGYTRQGVAIGIAMVAMTALGQGSIFRFVLWIALAATFHKSAIILLPMAVLANSKRRIFTFFWVGVTSIILFALMVQEALSFLMSGYIEDAMQSSGAAIRIAMNAVPAALFLLFRKRFQLSVEQRSFWSWMAWSALFLVLLLAVSPSSTAVDRIALYWIPLQLFVLSRLPNALGRRDGKNLLWVAAVLAYSTAVHFVWLFYADTAFAWLPYQFYPWVWLSQ
ncbi:MAG: EpsG family protein [Candidatus Methylopumilus sp.]|nr:EpsG family protein [Sulfuritalea sp.]MCF8193239.1 EpsG family protein [Candidatus Methylopumilus sp.]